MLFTDPLFLFLFLPALLAVYFCSPKAARNPLLLCASLLFYASGEGRFLLLLLFSVLLNYFFGLAIGRAGSTGRRRLFLCLGVSGNLLLLAVFKYAVFIITNFNILLAHLTPRVHLHVALLPVPEIHLPVGISFFTFMGISYLADIYWRQIEADRRLGRVALYVTLFPHLLAGPIVRYAEIAGELVSRRASVADFAEGVRRFVVGLGKKMLVANTLALTVDKIYATPAAQLTTDAAWLGAACYTLQIYFDFSGYTDMAVGLARMFGFHFPENFDYPYIAQSVSEFWRRWHMTLAKWFRDYLFFPMSFRRSRRRMLFNLLLVFLLCGLWHGASWNFVVWGAFYGAFLVLEQLGLGAWVARRPRVFRHAYLLLVVVTASVFVRSPSVSQSLGFMRAMYGFARGGAAAAHGAFSYMNAELLIVLFVAVLGSMPVVPLARARLEKLAAGFKGAPGLAFRGFVALANVAAMGLLLFASAAMSATGTYAPFIYFRF
jgi:alginate O-acetyltransferase complex protein AlgI